MNIVEELSCDGVAPSGPVSAWPEDRHKRLIEKTQRNPGVKHATKVKAGIGQMAKGVIKGSAQVLRHGKVSKEIRDERYDTCKACPSFIENSKRCSDCGCFMEAKTWIGGDPDMLCPQKKWSR